ncbi:MAG TPA: hypothetical protein VNY52_03790 [Solirubrobacteraceae bacterium]|nr:hypothetical protein [Solirubrobacteraceae bacterium]
MIQFGRVSEPQQRESRYRIIEVSDGTALCVALAAAIGIRGVVAKRRHLLWQSVRIHLDEVEQLGTFMSTEGRHPKVAQAHAARAPVVESGARAAVGFFYGYCSPADERRS